MSDETIRIDQVGCARCGRAGHPGMVFAKFQYPVEVENVILSHWSLCPNTGEPILMQVTEEQQGPKV